jgi:hypothetical protein
MESLYINAEIGCMSINDGRVSRIFAKHEVRRKQVFVKLCEMVRLMLTHPLSSS